MIFEKLISSGKEGTAGVVEIRIVICIYLHHSYNGIIWIIYVHIVNDILYSNVSTYKSDDPPFSVVVVEVVALLVFVFLYAFNVVATGCVNNAVDVAVDSV